MKPLILFCIVALTALNAIADDERVFDKAFDMAKAPTFFLENYKGLIKIRTHDQAVITVKARVFLTIDDDRLSDDEKNQMLDAMKIDFRHSDSRLHVVAEYEPRSFKRGFFGIGSFTPEYPQVDFDIVIPEDASIVVNSYKGKFDIEAGANYVQIESYKGSGTIVGVQNDFDINTYKGEFDIDIAKLSDVDLNTYKGNLDVTINGAQDFHLTAGTHKGDVDVFGLEADQVGFGERTHFDVRRGNGGNDIDANTYKGRISLRFQ